MDLVTLTAALFVALGLLSADAVMNANSVVVQVTAPAKIGNVAIEQATLEQEFEDPLYAISRVQSVIVPPEIHAGNDQGVGMALAKLVRLESVAYALQGELRARPDQLRFAVYIDQGEVRGLVSGSGTQIANFRQVMVPEPDENLLHFVQRSAIVGASQLAPYATAVYLLEQHAADKDFTDVVALIEQSERKLPHTPMSFDRSAFDNLLGIVALFQNNPKAAAVQFAKAVAEAPSNAVAVLNAAFVDLQLDDNHATAERMRRLVTDAPPANPVLLSTAYITWAAAELGLGDLTQADALLIKASALDPQSTTELEIWADLKELQGNKAAAADLRRRALQETETFENYAEVAALYFQLAWRDNQPVTRSKFTNPTIVTFH